MAVRNQYTFEKRQKDLAKKKEKEEKKREKDKKNLTEHEPETELDGTE